MQRVSTAELTETDFRWLLVAEQSDYTGVSVKDFMEGELHGVVQLWRVLPPAEGMVITEMREYNGVKRLVVLSLAGDKIAVWGRTIFRKLEDYARGQGCKYIVLYNMHRKLDKFYSKTLGATPRSVEFVKEL